MRSPFCLGSMPEPRNKRLPDLGEQTVEILRKAGFEDVEIAQLLAGGSVQASPTREQQVGS